MARPWRIEFPGACCHVMARGNNRQDIYLESSDREDFLGLLGRAESRLRFVDRHGQSLSQVAGLLNVTPAAVSLGIKRFKDKMKRDEDLRERMGKM